MSKNHREIGASLLLTHAHDTQVDIDGGTGMGDDVVVVEAYRACAALLTDEAEADRVLGAKVREIVVRAQEERWYCDDDVLDAIADALREEGGR